MCGGDGGDAVGDARPGGQYGESGTPGQLGHGLGGEHRALFVPDVDDAHRRVRVHGRVVQREYMPAGEGEHLLNAVGAECGQRELPAVSGQLRHDRSSTYPRPTSTRPT